TEGQMVGLQVHRGGLDGRGGGLDVADVVGGDAVEGVGVLVGAGVSRRGLGCRRLPARERAVVVGDVNGIGGDGGAASVVLAGPGHGDADRAEGRQRRDAAGWRAGVDCVEVLLGWVRPLARVVVVDLVGGDGGIDVENYRGDVANLRSRRQA